MTPRLCLIAADWLDRLCASGAPSEIGEVGPDGAYPPGIRQRLGPLVAGLHRAGLIAPADAVRSRRPSRRRSVAMRWRAVDVAACRAQAMLLRRQAAQSARVRVPSQPIQLSLF